MKKIVTICIASTLVLFTSCQNNTAKKVNGTATTSEAAPSATPVASQTSGTP